MTTHHPPRISPARAPYPTHEVTSLGELDHLDRNHSTLHREPSVAVPRYAGPLFTAGDLHVRAHPGERIMGLRTFFTGLFAGGALFFALILSWFFVADSNIPVLVAHTLGMRADLGQVTFSLILLLALYGGVALLYAWGFERLGRASAALGVAFSIPHALIMGGLLATIMALHPAYPSTAPGEWQFGTTWLGLLVFCLLHPIYGAIVGAIVETRATTVRAGSRLAQPNVALLRAPHPHLTTPIGDGRQPVPPFQG